MPTIVAQDLFRRSLILINAIGQGDVPEIEMMNDTMRTFNEMLDNWSTETLSVYGQNQYSLPLLAGVGTYTWGDGGTIDLDRPVHVVDANFRVNNTVTPVRIEGQDMFNAISSPADSAVIVERLTYINSYPLGTLKVWPIPMSDNTGLQVVTRRILSSITNLQQLIDVPPGYTKALRFNLAVDLWPEYSNPQTDIETIKRLAQDSKADIQRANSTDIEMSFSDIPGVGGVGEFNWGNI